jgi:hypothetical protein
LSGEWVPVALIAAFAILLIVAARTGWVEFRGPGGIAARRSNGSGARLGPSLRGLSPERIAAEVELYAAILRLQTARHDFPKAVKVPRDLDADIRRFWHEPESIGMRPGGETGVRNLTRRIVEFLPVAAEK